MTLNTVLETSLDLLSLWDAWCCLFLLGRLVAFRSRLLRRRSRNFRLMLERRFEACYLRLKLRKLLR